MMKQRDEGEDHEKKLDQKHTVAHDHDDGMMRLREEEESEGE